MHRGGLGPLNQVTIFQQRLFLLVCRGFALAAGTRQAQKNRILIINKAAAHRCKRPGARCARKPAQLLEHLISLISGRLPAHKLSQPVQARHSRPKQSSWHFSNRTFSGRFQLNRPHINACWFGLTTRAADLSRLARRFVFIKHQISAVNNPAAIHLKAAGHTFIGSSAYATGADYPGRQSRQTNAVQHKRALSIQRSHTDRQVVAPKPVPPGGTREHHPPQRPDPAHSAWLAVRPLPFLKAVESAHRLPDINADIHQLDTAGKRITIARS